MEELAIHSTEDAPYNGDAGLRRSVERALGLGGPQVRRLGTAGTSVSINVRGDAERSVTLLLDRDPPLVTGSEEPAEITIELDPDQARRFAGGTLVLPNCILCGEVAYQGPVRKYLTLDPVLRSLLWRASKVTP
jgi:hypothetical protein